jgi:hypothetical protein
MPGSQFGWGGPAEAIAGSFQGVRAQSDSARNGGSWAGVQLCARRGPVRSQFYAAQSPRWVGLLLVLRGGVEYGQVVVVVARDVHGAVPFVNSDAERVGAGTETAEVAVGGTVDGDAGNQGRDSG